MMTTMIWYVRIRGTRFTIPPETTIKVDNPGEPVIQTLDIKEQRTVIPETGEAKDVSPISVPAYCLESF